MRCTRKLLFSSTILAGVVALNSAAFAQSAPQTVDPEDEETQELDEIVVTGSRIPRPQYDGVIPGVQIGEEDIEERLFTNAGDILNDVPLVGAGANLNGTNGSQSASLGVTYIDLLNLGGARTLTLVNGRRFVSNNSATIFVSGNETGSQVDASTIPVQLIDRVDILTVGGAAAYGADAVAGVVNYVLRDDYEGAEVTILGGQTFEEQDAGRIAVSAVAGASFLEGRLNVAVSGEYTEVDSLTGMDRSVRSDNPGLLSNPYNGAQRNPAFVPLGTQPAFLPAASDGILPSVFANRVRTNSTWFGGAIFNVVANNGTAENPTIANRPLNGPALSIAAGQFQPGNMFRNPSYAQIAPAAYSFINGGTQQMVPGTPAGACIASATDVCQLAPATVTLAQARAAFARYGVSAPTQGATETTAQFNARETSLGLALLQSRRPTAREYYAANPNTPINAFLGTFLPGLPDIATPGGLAAVLPRTAVPLRFNSNGDVVTWDFAGRLAGDPTAPGTFSASDGGEGQNRQDASPNILRVQQQRWVSNVIANYQLTDSVRFFTENLYAKAKVISPLYNGGLFSGVSTSTPENTGILVNVNHPFLTNANRVSLANAGITGNFILSRNNEDVVNDISQQSINETFRTVNGFRGDFSFAGRDFTWELSHTFGKADTRVETSQINDVAFAMAIDVVNVGNDVVCRAQTVPGGANAYIATFGGTNSGSSSTSNIPGAIPQVTTIEGPNGMRQQVVYTPTVTQEMVDACRPLNIFGEGRASQAAKNFVSVRNEFHNESTQNFTQAILSGDVFDLPAGPLQFAVSGELRKEELDYESGPIDIAGRTRSAPSAFTQAEVETIEGGLELNIPILGNGFDLPFVKSLEFNPSVRWSQLEGSAAPYIGLPTTPGGTPPVISPTYKGDAETIYTLAGTWEVNDQLLFRGNISKSVRNPSIVELFLGGQPFFTNIAAASDPCAAANLGSGPNPTARRANCIAEVRRVATANGGTLLGSTGTAFSITDDASALAFLTGTGGFAASGAAFTGLISGRQTLVPEKGDSFTFGFVAQPKFIPNLIFAADYLEITVTDALGPLLALPAAQYCYDSSSYPDNTPEIGVNSCGGIRRDQQFNYTNGFELPFFNLGGTRVKAINGNFSWSADLADVFSSDQDLGTFGLRGNIYYLAEYSNSASGDFSDATPAERTLANPRWESSISALYNVGPFNARWTTSYTGSAMVLSGTTRATFEQANIVAWPASAIHTLSLGYDVTEQASVRLVVDNVTDNQELGRNGYYSGVYVETLGRRWTAALSYRF